MQVQIKPWGNSQGIRFSREFLASAGIQINDTLSAEVVDGKIVLSKQFVHRTLKQRAAAFGGELHLSDELSAIEPVGNEVW